MEALQLKTIADLLNADDERIELINGEIIKRPMARSEHALVQSGLSDEILPFKRKDGIGGWWIMTEISVHYHEHHCPTHDLAGWRKERVPARPTGIMETLPDWVCEITSPGHERKDLFTNFIALQRYQVPYYWVISPEDRTLIAYQLVGEHYHVVFSAECNDSGRFRGMKIPPFTAGEIDLGYVFWGN
ncbi:MAG: Uma2 family endonuclease [Thiothrix sp.]